MKIIIRIFITMIGYASITNIAVASSIGNYAIDMDHKKASALGIYYCEPTFERFGENEKYHEATSCQFSLKGEEIHKKGLNHVIFENTSKQIKKISALIFTSDFNKKINDYRTTTKEIVNARIDDILEEEYKIPKCNKQYYPKESYGLNTVCIFKPNVIRLINYPTYIGKNRHTVLGIALKISIYSNKKEYESIRKNTLEVEKKIGEMSYQNKNNIGIANDIQNGR